MTERNYTFGLTLSVACNQGTSANDELKCDSTL